MAHEHVLKLLVNGLASTASDFEKLARFLNIRAQLYGTSHLFVPAPYQPPVPRYPTKEESAAEAAACAAAIADAYAAAVKYFDADPSSPDPLGSDLFGEAELLELIASWQGVRAGVLKAILAAYGETGAPLPTATLPGPESEQLLWAEVSAWLEKIAADASSFSSAQRLQSGSRKSRAKSARQASIVESSILIEQAFHRATLDALLIAGKLPYHLFQTAHRNALRAKRRR
jgi:hypothetical protein